MLQPERPTAELELPADTVVVCAYGLLIPEALLERGLWLNVHPSLLPRWRGAAPVERALMAGDAETGRHDPRDGEGARRRADRGAARRSRSTPEDDAGAVYARAAELAVELLDEVLPEPGRSAPQEGEPTYAAKIEPDDRELDLSRPRGEPATGSGRSRRTSARAASCTAGRVTVWRARLEDGELVPVEVQPEGGRRMAYDAFLRGLR